MSKQTKSRILSLLLAIWFGIIVAEAGWDSWPVNLMIGFMLYEILWIVIDLRNN